MKMHVLILLTVVHSVLGQLQKYNIHQSPSDLVKFPEENTEVHCKHSVSEFYVMMCKYSTVLQVPSLCYKNFAIY
ncbi:hypothetical protein AMELA_G00127080 [Ameiurus melas]|uniref:Uncharacterized protein n=1 Tax=Ameiurus melas TaxID=219545 RepID=A0A7J6AS05_AMEME|nr:hypothetical protein AMELA_G00127080 [Ameiurus melas]